MAPKGEFPLPFLWDPLLLQEGWSLGNPVLAVQHKGTGRSKAILSGVLTDCDSHWHQETEVICPQGSLPASKPAWVQLVFHLVVPHSEQHPCKVTVPWAVPWGAGSASSSPHPS